MWNLIFESKLVRVYKDFNTENCRETIKFYNVGAAWFLMRILTAKSTVKDKSINCLTGKHVYGKDPKSWITELREKMQGMYSFRDFFVIFWSQTRVVMTTVSCSVVTVNFRRSCYERYLANQPGAVRKYQYNPWKHGRKIKCFNFFKKFGGH